MNTQAAVQSQDKDSGAAKRIISGDAVVGYATLGCLVAGTLALFKALTVDGVGAGLCLLASVAAFGTVCYIYFRKD